MDRTQACGACDRGSIPLEGVDTIKPPENRRLYGIYVYTERNRTGILKRECLHVLKTQGSGGARSPRSARCVARKRRIPLLRAFSMSKSYPQLVCVPFGGSLYYR